MSSPDWEVEALCWRQLYIQHWCRILTLSPLNKLIKLALTTLFVLFLKEAVQRLAHVIYSQLQSNNIIIALPKVVVLSFIWDILPEYNLFLNVH